MDFHSPDIAQACAEFLNPYARDRALRSTFLRRYPELVSAMREII